MRCRELEGERACDSSDSDKAGSKATAVKNLTIADIARIQRLNRNGRRIAPADVQALADTVEVMLQAFNAHSAADAGRSLLHQRAELKSLRLEVLEAEKQLQSQAAQIKELRSQIVSGKNGER